MREELGRDGPVVIYVTLGESQSLCLYTEQGFNLRAEELLGSTSADPDQLLAFESLWFSLARRVELDSAGRLRLPENLLRRTGLGAAVMLLGMNDHMEIRDREAWMMYVDQVLAEQQQILMNPRRAIRRAERSGN